MFCIICCLGRAIYVSLIRDGRISRCVRKRELGYAAGAVDDFLYMELSEQVSIVRILFVKLERLVGCREQRNRRIYSIVDRRRSALAAVMRDLAYIRFQISAPHPDRDPV